MRYKYNENDFLTARIQSSQEGEYRELYSVDPIGHVRVYTDTLGRQTLYTYEAKKTVEISSWGIEKIQEYNNRKDIVRVRVRETEIKTKEISI